MTPQPYNNPQNSGGKGCVTAVLGFLIFAIFFVGALVVIVVNGPIGKSFSQGFSQGFSGALGVSEKLNGSIMQMQSIDQALVRYHTANGMYPSDLSQLVPGYLADNYLLHSTIDTNPDPTHDSFVYTPPANNAPPSTPVLSLSGSFQIPSAHQTQTITITMALDGSMQRTQTIARTL